MGHLDLAIAEGGGRLPIGVELGPAPRAGVHVRPQRVELGTIDRVEGECPDQLGGLLVVHGVLGHLIAPLATSEARMRCRPDRIRLLIVPSGSSSICATSR